jgi:hypothetical protein
MKAVDIDMLPEPLTPVGCDLRGLPYMPLDVIRLLDSDMFAETTGDEFKAAVALWCKSWTQVPAASLPNKDLVLAHLSGNAAKWKRIKAGAMRGWILCSDDRWYHPVVAEKALAALPGREEFNHKKSADAERKAREREDRKALFEALRRHGVTPDWNVSTKTLRGMATQYLSQTPPPHVTDNECDMSQRVTVCKGEGEKKGELTDKNKSSSSHPPPPRDDDSSFGPPPGPAANPTRAEQVTQLLLAQDIVTTSGNPFVVAWSQDPQVTDEVLNVAIAKARKTKGAEEIVPKYLAKTIATVLDEQSAPVLTGLPPGQPAPALAPAPNRKPKGNEPKGTDESYDEWQARVDAYEAARRNGQAA